MAENTFGGFFISDDDELLQESPETPAPVFVPQEQGGAVYDINPDILCQVL